MKTRLQETVATASMDKAAMRLCAWPQNDEDSQKREAIVLYLYFTPKLVARTISTPVSPVSSKTRRNTSALAETAETRLKPRAPNGHLPDPGQDHFNDDTMNPRLRKQRLRRKNEGIYAV